MSVGDIHVHHHQVPDPGLITRLEQLLAEARIVKTMTAKILDLVTKGSEVTPAQLEQLKRMGEKVEKIDQEK